MALSYPIFHLPAWGGSSIIFFIFSISMVLSGSHRYDQRFAFLKDILVFYLVFIICIILVIFYHINFIIFFDLHILLSIMSRRTIVQYLVGLWPYDPSPFSYCNKVEIFYHLIRHRNPTYYGPTFNRPMSLSPYSFEINLTWPIMHQNHIQIGCSRWSYTSYHVLKSALILIDHFYPSTVGAK